MEFNEKDNHCVAITRGIYEYFELTEKDIVNYDGVFSINDKICNSPRDKYFLFVGSITYGKGVLDAVKAFVYDNVHEETKPLRFYCIHSYEGSSLELIPMTLTEAQMRSIQRIHENLDKDVIVSSDTIQKFEKGELVRVVEGKFAGVVGRVARFRGQQRVGITINGLYTIVTAYVPKAFLKPISGHRQRVLDVAPHNDEGDENPSE